MLPRSQEKHGNCIKKLQKYTLKLLKLTLLVAANWVESPPAVDATVHVSLFNLDLLKRRKISSEGFGHLTPAAVSATRLRSVKDVFHFCGMGCTRVFPIYFKCCWYLMRLEELGREAADEKRRRCSWTQIVQMYPQELQLGCVVTAGQEHIWPYRMSSDKTLLHSPFTLIL